MTAQRNRYHKHIFAGSERIATKVGGGIPHAYLPPNDQDTLMPQMPPEIPVATQSTTAPLAANDSTWDNFLHQTASCLGVQRQNLTLDFTLVSLQEKVPITETQVYYYHTDHLGSTGFLSATLSTTGGARLVQHYQYMPFGELFVHQNTQQYHNPYDFSARERDIESGFQYFGARHYHSEWGIWLSVDPLADLAPHLTPYRYAFNNPIRYHDPTGLIEVARDGGGEPDPNPDVIIYSTKSVFSIEADRIRTPFANATSYNPWDNFKSQLTGMYAQSELMKQNTTQPSLQPVLNEQLAALLSVTGNAAGFLSLCAGAIEHLGGLEKATELIAAGKFEVVFNGEMKQWSMKFTGNKTVPAEFVKIEKARFIAFANSNMRALNIAKAGGVVLTLTGGAVSFIQFKSGLIGSAEFGADMAFTGVAIYGGATGWVLSSLYFGAKVSFSSPPAFNSNVGGVDISRQSLNRHPYFVPKR